MGREHACLPFSGFFFFFLGNDLSELFSSCSFSIIYFAFNIFQNLKKSWPHYPKKKDSMRLLKWFSQEISEDKLIDEYVPSKSKIITDTIRK